jgi:hypothetical protein
MLLQRSLVDLCYSIPDQPIYGELTNGSLKKLQSVFYPASHVVDVGSGSGNALRVLMSKQTTSATGYEVSTTRYNLCMSLKTNQISFFNTDIMLVSAFPLKTTHVYSFDKAFPKRIRLHVQALVAACPSIQLVATTRPDIYLNENWVLMRSFRVFYHGGHGSCVMYVFQASDLM